MSSNLHVTLASPEALNWLRRGSPARIIHAFTASINVMDQNGEIMSLVQPQIGPGPFTAVVERQAGSHSDMAFMGNWDFTKVVDVHSIIRARGNTIEIGDLSVQFASALSWDPEPAWHQIESSEFTRVINIIERSIIDRAVFENGFLYPNEGQLSGFHGAMVEAWVPLSAGLRQKNPILCRKGAGGLVGLGSGFTPAGDDFLVGVIFALYAVERGRSARSLATVIAEEAMLKTTRLSFAWLKAAMHGEATEAWHVLIAALAAKNSRRLFASIQRIKETGHSSGVAALAGFVNGTKALIAVD